jgi:hypothetical protein
VRNNTAGHRRWWSAPGRTLEFVLEHIERGNDPVLEMPPLPRELLDATADGIRLLWLSVLWISDEVGITVHGIHVEDRQAGAVIHATEVQ